MQQYIEVWENAARSIIDKLSLFSNLKMDSKEHITHYGACFTVYFGHVLQGVLKGWKR
jgi:hypothetical protein